MNGPQNRHIHLICINGFVFSAITHTHTHTHTHNMTCPSRVGSFYILNIETVYLQWTELKDQGHYLLPYFLPIGTVTKRYKKATDLESNTI
jgi:hypothetical protein